MPDIQSAESFVSGMMAYKGYAAAAGVGYAAALVVPVSDLAVGLFRLAVRFPLVRIAIRKNPDAVKKGLDAIEQALAHEVDMVAGKPEAPKP